MKKITILSVFALTSLTLITSCKKDEHTHDTEAAVSITNPTEGAMFNQGDTVHINATVTSEAAMHGWEVTLTNKTTNTQLLFQEEHDHAATYTITGYWVNNVTADATVEVDVTAILDHDGNTAYKKVEIHCHQ